MKRFLTHESGPTDGALPKLKLDAAGQAEFDLLVDDELSENRRSELLRGMDKFSDGWRQLAICFLENQAQRRAFRGLVQGEEVSGARREPGASGGFRRIFAQEYLRIAAAVLITASVFSLAGILTGRRAASIPAGQPFSGIRPPNASGVAVAPASGQPRQIHMLTPSLPGGLTMPGEFGGNPAVSQGVPTAFPAGSASQNRIMVVSDGPNQVMAFPMAPASQGGRPVY